MNNIASTFCVSGIMGQCGDLEVFIGFVRAAHLVEHSFADILQEETGVGYQRPYNKSHSLGFKKYISLPNASTPPLIFNLRRELDSFWNINRGKGGTATLNIEVGSKPLSQVDCQHRLGELGESDVSLAFMTFVGLDLRGEMAMFNVINGKSKGLSSSLTDFHESRLVDDLITSAPHLYISRKLNEDPNSPWYQMIKYGGERTSGLMRRTSLRMMQRAVKEFLSRTGLCRNSGPEAAYEIISNFWGAIKYLFPKEWNDHRHHLLTKGVGLYSLMKVLCDCVNNYNNPEYSIDYFTSRLEPLVGQIDWCSKGEFASANGRKGANEIYLDIKERLNS